MTRTLNRTTFKLKKHSPEILIVAGVIGTVTSTVMACKATTKLNGILEDSKERIDQVHYAMDHPETLPDSTQHLIVAQMPIKKCMAIDFYQCISANGIIIPH